MLVNVKCARLRVPDDLVPNRVFLLPYFAEIQASHPSHRFVPNRNDLTPNARFDNVNARFDDED
jgi:hypothetical protein